MAAVEANAIMAEIIDKVDKILFKHGFEFDEESHTWEDAVTQLSAWVFNFYNDYAMEGSYEPQSVSSSSGSDMEEDSTTVTDPEEEVDLNP